jgi:DNA ligase D-like protein (predicted 3'-phosphoesterase)
MNKVLKSWAVPKQPPRKKGIKRLAIQVEDHPIEYAKFKGTIPEGNYGAGKVEIWDKGTYELIDAEGDPFGKKTPKKIELKLHGKKLKGNYILIKTNYGPHPKQSWLFFKI